MKLIIEPKDVERVKHQLALGGILLTDEQATFLIETYTDLAVSLYELKSYFDSQSKHRLFDIVIDWLLKDVPAPKGEYIWSWPDYESSESYKISFRKAFREAALATGVSLATDWETYA